MHAPEHWPAAIERVNENGCSPFVLLCEHAANYIPHEYGALGLSPQDLQRHIAWDIGAADLARQLARMLDAPAFLGTFSRLLVDLNRPLRAADSIVARSEATDIPGNRDLSEPERARRVRLIFTPYHDHVARHFEQRRAQGRPTRLVSIHSFTPVFHGKARPWHAGVLYGAATSFAESLLARLRRDESLNVGSNVPYGISADEDYGLLVYGDEQSNPAALIEVRQDLIADRAGVDAWAERIRTALQSPF